MSKVKFDTSSSHFVTVGTVRRSHGLHGEVLVAFRAGTFSDVLIGRRVWITPPLESISESEFVEVSDFNKGHRVKLAYVDSIDTASLLNARNLVMALEDIDSLTLSAMDDSVKEDERVGLRVSAEVYGDLGVITEVLITGANDVLVVEGPYGEVLLPAIPDVVLDTDFKLSTMRVFVLDGLIDSMRQD